MNGAWINKSQGLPTLDLSPYYESIQRYYYPYIGSPRSVSLVADPKIPSRLYAELITNERKYPHSVYVKPDAHSPWETFSVGLENAEVNALSMNPGERLLYAATTAGIYYTPLYEASRLSQSFR